MVTKADLGTKAGQHFSVLKSIQSILKIMTGGGAKVAHAVVKELLQNADDAGATEVSLVLDERVASNKQGSKLSPLTEPALLVRNNAAFKRREEVPGQDLDDFSAILEVASEHKLTQVTAAGKFGIGFNSVYFLTDHPVLFSRQEIHIFDLLNRLYDANGWRYTLEDCTVEQELCEILDWCFPSAVIGEQPFETLAASNTDYRQTVFRFPLRKTTEGIRAVSDDRFGDHKTRRRLFDEMVDEAARSIVFLKNVTSISFYVLSDDRPRHIATIKASETPSEFRAFLQRIEDAVLTENTVEMAEVSFPRLVERTRIDEHETSKSQPGTSEDNWLFQIYHRACFDDPDLLKLRQRLQKNNERAVPWVSIAVPITADSLNLDSGKAAHWRVALPLLEDGPSKCIFSGAFFVDPTRQRMDYRRDENDQGERRTQWNQLLVERGLVPLLQKISFDLPALTPELIATKPDAYLALFPSTLSADEHDRCLTDYMRQCFGHTSWQLTMMDIWDQPFSVIVGDSNVDLSVELIPEWLASYKGCFRTLASKTRIFIRNALGTALKERLSDSTDIKIIRTPSSEVIARVLRHSEPPDAKDLRQLIKLLLDQEQRATVLGGAWAFVRGADQTRLRYEPRKLYIVNEQESKEPLLSHLRTLNLPTGNVEWVDGTLGLPSLMGSLPVEVDNVVKADKSACLQFLRVLPDSNSHDLVSETSSLAPVFDFLIGQSSAHITEDLRLGFLVKTAPELARRRELGVVLLPPRTSDPETEALWLLWFDPLFAKVEETCALQLHRLLKKHSTCIQLMQASDCRLIPGDLSNAIAIFAQVRLADPGSFELLAAAINQADEELSLRVSTSLLSEADRRWDSLSEGERRTILTLPIHRRADGKYVSLSLDTHADPAYLQQRYRLQADEDVDDAPIELSTCTLLQVPDPSIKHFYKRRLGLISQDRAFVLQETLQQVGTRDDYEHNKKMLRYIARHLRDAFEHEYRADLRLCLSKAKVVPCLDGIWRKPEECAQAWEIFEALTIQAWPRESMESLLAKLFPEEHIAKFDTDLKEILPNIQDIKKKGRHDIPKQAVQSPSKELTLEDRLTLLAKNLPSKVPDNLTVPEIIREVELPLLAGPARLADAEVLSEQVELPREVVQKIIPTAVDIASLSRQWKLKAEELQKILTMFGVSTVTAEQFNARLLDQIQNVWTLLTARERAQMIQYFNKNNMAQQLSTTDALAAIALSLPDFGEACTPDVYKLIADICQQSDTADSIWKDISCVRPVFYSFRQPLEFYTAKQIFIGATRFKADLSPHLVCLRSEKSAPKEVESWYKALGVPQSPTVEQIVAALSSFTIADPAAEAAYSRLLDTLEELSKDIDTTFAEVPLGDIRIVSCLGTYQRLSDCYWDDLFARSGRVSPSDRASRLADMSNHCNARLHRWLCDRESDVLRSLRDFAGLFPVEPPSPIELSPEQERLVGPWRRWLSQLSRQNSALRAELLQAGLIPPEGQIELVPVGSLKVSARFPDGTLIEQDSGWVGPVALESKGNLYVQVTAECAGDQFDRAIATELSRLLVVGEKPSHYEHAIDRVVSTLERPATLLRQLREKYRLHFLHQYQDQVPDPEFAELFDEYQALDRNCAEAKELEQRMYEQLEKNYVPFRRESIRAFGYDEVSVYAELIQNAEDAYVQGAALGMPGPTKPFVRFKCSSGPAGRTLDVQHAGRQFNCWQYRDKEDKTFARDVEGVLRSSGSFKPHSALGNDQFTQTIGKFGLGFKSVFLLTDRPEIHSGEWHFAVEFGCLPREVEPIKELFKDNTLIRLPLRKNERLGANPERLLSAMPFLRLIDTLQFSHDETNTKLAFETMAETILSTRDAVVERVSLHCKDAAIEQQIVFLRVRDLGTQAQLALLLSSQNQPALWDERFVSDLYAVLPLRSELKCGVAVSHAFEVQSGRTHLVDPEKNKARFTDVAQLIKYVPAALLTLHAHDQSEALSKFWTLWRWDRGDAECDVLRRSLAVSLADLALQDKVVPTLDSGKPLAFKDSVCFYFADIPDALWKALINVGITIPLEGMRPMVLTSSNVIAEGIASSYRRLCEYASRKPPSNLIRIGWKEVEMVLQTGTLMADKPQLVSILGKLAKANPEHKRRFAGWLSKVALLAESKSGRIIRLPISKLFQHEFPAAEHLPQQYLTVISKQYDEAALELLLDCGLKCRPSDQDLIEWIADEITTEDAVGILRYLSLNDNFSVHHNSLKELFRSAWFPYQGQRMKCADALRKQLIPDGLIVDVFKAWLGLSVGEPPPGSGNQPPKPDPAAFLKKLASWWDANSASYSHKYEHRLYPGSKAPRLQKSFDRADAADRQRWLTLLLLGVFHKMGRTQYEQHRDFLIRCDRKNWWSTLTDANATAEQWMELLTGYLDDESNDCHQDYEWVRQFVSIYQISRWLPAYVEAFLQLQKLDKPFSLYQVTDIRSSELFTGTGLEAPSLRRALGIGACFVLRELTRLRVVEQPHAHPYCFVPLRRTRGFLEEQLGCSALGLASTPPERSKVIYEFLVEHLGRDRATFNGSFDLALLSFLEDREAQLHIYGQQVEVTDDGGEI